MGMFKCVKQIDANSLNSIFPEATHSLYSKGVEVGTILESKNGMIKDDEGVSICMPGSLIANTFLEEI